MNNFLKINLVLILVLSFSSCNKTPDGEISWQPASLDLTPPPGPPEYTKGWSDGCESGANAYSNNFYKMVKAFDYRYDASLRKNKMYTQVWKDAFIYCSIYWERTNPEFM
jgi:hypothetical protein